MDLVRRLIMKVSQKKTIARKKISNNKRKTEVDYESMESGAF